MDQPADSLIARLSGRDSRQINRDNINITLDTSGEGRYGYWFGINLGDSLMDGTVLPERQFTSDWDGAWRGASQVTENGWSAEFHIPWGTVSMPQTGELRRLGLYMSRKVAYRDERWGWPALPDTVPKFMSALQTLTVRNVAPKQQYSVYPFAAVAHDEVDGELNTRIGADVFWRPSTNFQLTATVNPDFGIVESDDNDINLTALETFFPEKRLFFLEGQEIFIASPRADTRGRGVGNAGAPTTLINTRRIGGRPVEPVADGLSVREKDLIQPVELLGAAKLTGQYGRFRYGALAAFEDEARFRGTYSPPAVPGNPAAGDVVDPAILMPGRVDFRRSGSDYGVVRVLYEDVPGGAYRAFGVLSTAVLRDSGDALVQGVDGHYLSADGKLKIDGQVFTSDIDGIERGFGGFVDFQYTFRKGVRQRLGIEFQDEHVDINDLGFIQRNDNFRVRSAHTRTVSNLGWARDNQFDVRGFVQRNRADLFTGGGVFLSNRLTFNNLHKLTLRASWFAGAYDDLNSFGNGAYRIEPRHDWSFSWETDSSQALGVVLGGGYAQEQLGGDIWKGNFAVNWRPSDRFNTSIKASYQDREGWLLHQENANITAFTAEQWFPSFNVDYFLSARQQFRVSLQWVGIKAWEDKFYQVPATPGELIPVTKPAGPSDSFSLSQVTLQARYRWEIAPLSDIFVVYTRFADQGARLTEASSFDNVFEDAFESPLTDLFVVKIRYRFGS